MTSATFLIRMTLAVLALAFTATAIRAEAPGKPIEFGASVVEEGSMVKLTWMANRDGGEPTMFCIFIAEGETENEDDFELLKEDDFQPNPNGLYSYLVKDLEPGTYTFFIKAKNDDGTSERSIIRVVTLKKEEPKEPRIEIVGKNAFGIKTGEAWEQELKYESNFDPTAVSWEIVEGPDGLKIDEETGVLSWDEPQEGRYEVVVKVTATTDDGKTVTSTKTIVIEVGDGENEGKKKCAVIAGTVKGDGGDGAPAMGGWVYAWSMEQLGNSEKVRERVYKAQIRQGTYAIEVPAGTYRLQVEGEGFYSEWYEDAENADAATEVNVECNNRAEANFLVKYRPEPEMKTVCGTVYDAETNDPIFNALITFEVREDRENHPNGRYKRVLAESDEDGNYCVEVPAGYTYIATAKARKPNGERDEYLREYYDNTNDASQATGITVDDNMDGIDFPMDKKPTYEGGFSGTMMDDETEDGIPGKVIAYMIRESNSGKGEGRVRIQTVETDENGNYEFKGLEPGTYIVMGLPGERPYAPGWHTDGTAAASWRDADEIEVNDIMLTVQHDIRLEKVTDNVGRGHLRGWVSNRGGVITKDGGRVQADVPVAGAMVYAYDASNLLVDAAVAADDGSFLLTNLPLGDMILAVDRIDFQPHISYPQITVEALDQEVNVSMFKIVTNVDVPLDRVGQELNLYPNPTSGSATLTFPAVDGAARIQIVSSTGVALSSRMVDVSRGEATIELNTTDLPSGMVMVQVVNGTATFALPLQIVR